jgi:hypothetical protein
MREMACFSTATSVGTLVSRAVSRDRIGAQGQVIPKPDGGYEACTVERVESDNPFGVGPEAKVTLLRSDATVPAAKYWLRFKGWNDMQITYF